MSPAGTNPNGPNSVDPNPRIHRPRPPTQRPRRVPCRATARLTATSWWPSS